MRTSLRLRVLRAVKSNKHVSLAYSSMDSANRWRLIFETRHDYDSGQVRCRLHVAVTRRAATHAPRNEDVDVISTAVSGE